MALKQRLFSLTGPQEQWLLTRAGELGISHAELMRRILDAARGEIGEILNTSSRAPAIMAERRTTPPTERAALLAALLTAAAQYNLSHEQISEIVSRNMNGGMGGDWRDAGNEDLRAAIEYIRVAIASSPA